MRPNFAHVGRPAFSARRAMGPAAEPGPFKGKALRRRLAMFREAAELLPHLPQVPGEAVHAIMTGRYDLCVLLAAILGHVGQKCPLLRIATLSFNSRNVSEMSEMLRSGQVDTLTLLCSAFFRDNSKEEFAAARRAAADFPGWRIAAARNHCKVICASFADGRRLVLEGSANLRTNSNWEQLAIIMDAELHDWHARWIDDLVSRHEHETAGRQDAEQ